MKTLIIDVREPEEYAKDHVEGAINIPPNELIGSAPKLEDEPRDTRLVLYCVTGARSRASIGLLRGRGFTNLHNGINQHHVKQMIARGQL